MSTSTPRRVSYFYDADVGSYTYGLGHPMKPHRIRMTHELISAYSMLSHPHLTHLRPPRASAQEMTCFHTDEYIHFLSRVTPETVEDLTFRGTQFLVGDDNPAFEGVWEFCTISAGGSLAAAKRINDGSSDIAINWAGGLHHAKKREASGFCYINDIVLAILDLLRVFPRVLYVDIDCHHGDGVEEAFYTTDRVMTASFHKYGEYFPGTGTQEDRGRGKGQGYALNVPLKDGMTDATFKSVFDPVMERIIEVFRPSVVVLQCGADSLSGDKLGCFNLTMQGHAHCTSFLRAFNIPLILLGGGGYTVKNVARAWCYETACALGVQEQLVDPNTEGSEGGGMMPWNDYFEWFGPRYRLEVVKNNMEDVNLRIADPSDASEDSSLSPAEVNHIPLPRTVGRGWKQTEIDRVRERALQQLKELESRMGAPSVQMQDVPRESVQDHIGYVDEGKEQEWRDDLDIKLAQHSRLVYQLQTPSYPSSHHRRHPSPSSSNSSPSTSDDEDEERDYNSEHGYDSDNSYHSTSRRSTRSHTRNVNGNGHRSGSTTRRAVNGHTQNGHSHPPSSSSAYRKRMSIISNSVYEIPLCSGDTTVNNDKSSSNSNPPSFNSLGKTGRRRFFFDTGLSSLGALAALAGGGSVGGAESNGIHGVGTVPSSRGASPMNGISVSGERGSSRAGTADYDMDDGEDNDNDGDTMVIDSRGGTPRNAMDYSRGGTPSASARVDEEEEEEDELIDDGEIGEGIDGGGRVPRSIRDGSVGSPRGGETMLVDS
ncbi:hypothetical protein GYMLUDRAFT_76904 [Collybiopsis luxurians FD-317 M1]|uniref:histone deacetylase n=1 Tax=Collybiopsis luxurians FD-317 M1 TaxID=944289 RepID=A0A0D0CID5_9AGAR|nr:hypothetical protein GYMLUDRAFT_76904 [Collybiopsis luxurians FD-317 M1]